MWLENLSEVVPGLVILGCLLLWWQTRTDLSALRNEWDAKLQELVTTLADAGSWDEAIELLKAYGQDDV
jgi:hypothetical protein